MFQVQNHHIVLNWGSRQSLNNRPPNTTWTTACSRVKTSKSQSPITTSICCCRWRSSRPRSLCWKNAVKISILTQIILLSLTHIHTHTIHFLLFQNKIRKENSKIICHQFSHLSHAITLQIFPLCVDRKKISFSYLSVETLNVGLWTMV